MSAPTQTPASPAADGGTDLAEYLRALRMYAWLVVLFTIGASAVAVAVTVRQARIYEASCVIEYDPNPPRPLGEGVEDVAEPISDFWSSHEFFETQNHIIASRLIAERVVERLGLHHDRSFVTGSDEGAADWPGVEIAEAALILQSRLTVEGVDGTRLVQIRVQDRSPERAALIANTIADTFIEKTVEDRLGSTVTSLEWLGEQLDSLRQELDGSELALHAFKQEHNILSVSMEDRQNLVSAQVEHFNAALNTARSERIQLRARLTRLRVLRDSDSDHSGVGFEEFTTVQELQTLLRTQVAEREALASRYGVEHPRMQEVDERITTLREQLSHEVDGIIRAAEADLREASEVEAGIQREIDAANAAGLELNLLEIEYGRLSRTRENNEKLYGVVLERTTETDLTRMLRTTHVHMVDRALDPTAPVSPRVATNVAAGTGLGLLAGLLVALLLGRLDRRIKSARDVEDQGLTVLGVLPAISTVDEPATRARRRRGPTGDVRRDLVAHTHPMSSIAENCRTIRTNLMFTGEEPLRTLAISSANPQEGKTTVTCNLAISLAQSGKRVLVVDTDMRRPRVHHAFGLSGKRGLTSMIVGEAKLEDVVQETVVGNLWILACGPIPPNPAELLHRETFRALIEEARERYDLVIFDSPPLSAVADAAVLAPQLDGVLLVVRANRTTRDAIRSVLRQVRDVGARVVGGVLNGLDPRAKSEGGYYYYGRDGYYSSAEDDSGDPPAPPSDTSPPRPQADAAE